jgi:cytidylate kinase
MKQILIIDREFGAGCGVISEQIAARLGWKLFDGELTREIANRAKIPVDVCRKREERTDPWLHRLVNMVWRGTFDRNLPSPDLAILDTDRLVSIIRNAVEHAAESRPCVIVGRGAPYFLRDRPDTFSVFLYASRDVKYRRILERTGNEAEAVTLLDSMDDDRRKFVKHYFGHEWPNRQLFQAMLNTGTGCDLAMETILHLLNAANQTVEAGKK